VLYADSCVQFQITIYQLISITSSLKMILKFLNCVNACVNIFRRVFTCYLHNCVCAYLTHRSVQHCRCIYRKVYAVSMTAIRDTLHLLPLSARTL